MKHFLLHVRWKRERRSLLLSLLAGAGSGKLVKVSWQILCCAERRRRKKRTRDLIALSRSSECVPFYMPVREAAARGWPKGDLEQEALGKLGYTLR